MQAAVSCVWAKFERDDSEVLQNSATRRAVLHNHLAKICCSLPEKTNAVVDFDEAVAAVKAA